MLFQRLVAVRDKYEDTSALFKYEMCTFHPSLFGNFALPREANKPQLADAIWSTAELDDDIQTAFSESDDVHFLLDGGALLNRIPWQCGHTFASILALYDKYVADHYGRVITVVFDGYESGPSTKDATKDILLGV